MWTLLDPLRADGRPERFLGLSYQQGIALVVMAIGLAWRDVEPRLTDGRAPG
jgi:hypothetical protein